LIDLFFIIYTVLFTFPFVYGIYHLFTSNNKSDNIYGLLLAGFCVFIFFIIRASENGRQRRRGVPEECIGCIRIKQRKNHYSNEYSKLYRIEYACDNYNCHNKHRGFLANRSDYRYYQMMNGNPTITTGVVGEIIKLNKEINEMDEETEEIIKILNSDFNKQIKRSKKTNIDVEIKDKIYQIRYSTKRTIDEIQFKKQLEIIKDEKKKELYYYKNMYEMKKRVIKKIDYFKKGDIIIHDKYGEMKITEVNKSYIKVVVTKDNSKKSFIKDYTLANYISGIKK